MRSSLFLPLLGALSFRHVFGLAPTDEYRDADIQQSGYLPNHNMDPSVVDSAAFGQLWKVSFNNLEQFYAKPLTYTPLAGGPQLLFLASSMNYIRTLDAKTGTLINSRQVHTPFLQSDIGCTDIPNYIGIIGTPTIDPATDIVYFYSKTYIPNLRIPGNTGVQNGVYYFHAVNITTLADVYPPILIDGTVADNAPLKYFVGGIILQRPSLAQIGNVVYGAFGGHCDQYNYTGVVIGIDVVRAKVVTQIAMESGPLAAQTNDLLLNGGGGEGGIWMSGMGLASDGERLFAVTGNGGAHENLGAPAAGSSGLQTLGETALNLAVDSTTGVLSVSDYFQPYDYVNMDAADQDFGSGGMVLLDPATFSGGGVNKIAVTAGKNGKVYILNVDNLGGYKLGPGQTDGNLQTIATNEAVFGGAGSYPGEGGYVYFTPVGKSTQAYSLGFTSTGTPEFSFAGQSNEISAGRVGTGVPTVTSLNGEAGTAILWMTDPDAGLRAWYAVPQNGILQTIPLPQVGGANKFQRPAFGDGRLYVTDSNGVLYCLGSPVNLPLNCSSPVDFGDVAIGKKATRNITCTANIAITSIVGLEVGSGYFTASNSSLPNGPIAAGASFTFPVTWDLSNIQNANTQNSSFGSIAPGIKSTPLTLITINGSPGYATSFPISLTGTEVSTTPFLSVTPSTLDFGPVIVLDPSNIPSLPGIITIANKGLSNLTILGYGYTTNELSSSPTFTNSTFDNKVWDLGYGFTAATLPAIGSTIAPNSAISVPVTFNAINGTGAYASYWQVWSDGGSVNIILEASAATPPVTNFSISNGSGGWLPQSNLLMDFGKVAPGSSSSLQIQICNGGGSSLEIDKSKPPNGVFHISDPAELHESQVIPPGQCAYGTVLFNANTEEYNIPDLVLNNSWTLNTNDLNWGVHVVQITGTVVSTKVGPTNSNGSTVYNYLGCFAESTVGPRLFPNEPLSPSQSMNNANCQTACYGAASYTFAGTQYADECWCGNTPPPLANQDLTDTLCNTACPGDPNDRCGATGYLSVFYDPTKYIAGTDPSLYGPQTVQKAGNFVYQGCYSEGTLGRALAGAAPNAPAAGFTIELCEAACQGYLYFGMEYANQCYCGDSIGTGSVNQSSSVPSVSGCSMTCAGNSLEFCGGPNRLNLYMQGSSATSSVSAATTSTSASTSIVVSSTPTSVTSSPAPSGPTAVTAIIGGTYLGCYTEGTNSRALTGLANPVVPATNNSVESCRAACSSASFQYFGVEYSQECYCGNVINAGSVPTSSGCNMVCAGNGGEFCGGPNRLNMYMLNAISSSSSSVISTLSTSTTISSSSSSVIPTLSTSTTMSSSSISAILTSSTSSTVSSSSISTISTSSTSSTVSSSPAPSGPTTVTTISGGAYLGCYTEGTNIRALSGLANPVVPATNNSVESCQAACSSASFQYFGVEYSQECYCGNVINTGSVPASSGCNMACVGNSMEICGGPNRLNMYMLNTVTSSSSSSPSIISTSSTSTAISSSIFSSSSTGLTSTTTSLISSSSSSSISSSTISPTPTPTGPITVTKLPGYSYLGCYSEATATRALSGLLDAVSPGYNSVEACAAACSKYTYFGVEYSSECYCGNVINAGSVNQTSSDPAVNNCNMVCAGNSGELCGGPNRLNMYMVASGTSSSSSVLATISPSSSSSSSSMLLTSSISSSSQSSISSSSSSASLSSSATGIFVTTSITTSYSSSTSSSSSSVLSTSRSSLSSLTSSVVLSSSSVSSATSSSLSLTFTSTSSSRSSLPTSSSSTTSSSLLSLNSSSGSSSRSSSSTSLSLSSIVSSSISSATSLSLSSFTSTSTSSSKSPTSTSSSSSSMLSPTSLVSSTSLSTSSTPSPSPTTSGTATPLWTGTPAVNSTQGSWRYLGCANEPSGTRALSGSAYSSGTGMTIETCQAFCAANNYALAGTEYASQCYCANALSTGSTLGQTGCNMMCSGLSTETCGGSSLLSVFNNTAYIYPSSPPKVGSYQLAGCYKEATTGRLLSGATYTNTTSMTVESCVSFCAANGADGLVAGVEYSQECYCAGTLPSTAVLEPASNCNMLCKGNNKEFCGAAGMLNVYSYVAGSKRARRFRGRG